MRKLLLSLVAGTLAVGALAVTPGSAWAGHGRWDRRVIVHRAPAWHWQYHYWYRLPHRR